MHHSWGGKNVVVMQTDKQKQKVKKEDALTSCMDAGCSMGPDFYDSQKTTKRSFPLMIF